MSRSPAELLDCFLDLSHTVFRVLGSIGWRVVLLGGRSLKYLYINAGRMLPIKHYLSRERIEFAEYTTSLLLFLARIDTDILYAKAPRSDPSPPCREESTRKLVSGSPPADTGLRVLHRGNRPERNQYSSTRLGLRTFAAVHTVFRVLPSAAGPETAPP